jgi:hypothetical protein
MFIGTVDVLECLIRFFWHTLLKFQLQILTSLYELIFKTESKEMIHNDLLIEYQTSTLIIADLNTMSN